MESRIESPTLETERLLLRPFRLSDASDIQRLAGHYLIYLTTAGIPHPYPDGAAEEWVAKQEKWFQDRVAVHFALTLKSTGELIGCMTLFGMSKTHRNAELGYWIAVDEWGKGYATEAGREVLHHGFGVLNLHRVQARHQSNNSTSGRVLEKLGRDVRGLSPPRIF